MSKMVVSGPGGVVRAGLIGASASLVSYVLLQFVVALLLHCQVLGEGMIYLLVCVAAAISSFVGCVIGVVRGGEKAVLSASTVTLVFLTVTITVGVLSGDSESVADGLVGVGSAMAFGGLLAAVMLVMWSGHRETGRRKRKKRR